MKHAYDFSYLLPLCLCSVKLSGQEHSSSSSSSSPTSLFPTSPRSIFAAISNWLVQHTQLSGERNGLHSSK